MQRSAIGMLLLAVAVACADDGDADAASETGGGTTSTTAGTDDGTSSGTTLQPDTSTGSTETTDGVPVGCDGASLLANPTDTSLRGAWPVGVRTVTIDDLRVEVWYPAVVGSESGVDSVVYDIREQLPDSEQGKISDDDNPWQPCNCWRDLPVDTDHGPYPAIVFVHGTASFRTQSLPQMVHWASRGFVVLAADHPGLSLADTLGSVCGGGMVARDLEGDVGAMLAAVRAESPELEFLADRIDATRIGMAGHSAGGGTIAGFGDDAQVLVPMASGGTEPGSELRSTLVLGGTADSVVAYSQQQSGFEASPSPKRFVGIAEAGHLTFSEICSLRNAAGDDLLTIANDNGVCGAQFAGVLFQCGPELIPDPQGWTIIDDTTAAVFEETLHCSDAGSRFADLQQRYPQVADYEEG